MQFYFQNEMYETRYLQKRWAFFKLWIVTFFNTAHLVLCLTHDLPSTFAHDEYFWKEPMLYQVSLGHSTLHSNSCFSLARVSFEYSPTAQGDTARACQERTRQNGCPKWMLFQTALTQYTFSKGTLRLLHICPFSWWRRQYIDLKVTIDLSSLPIVYAVCLRWGAINERL